MTENRFELRSVHFYKLEVVIYDKLEDKELNLSIYDLIVLLNDIAQSEYDLKMLKEDIIRKIDEVILE